MSQYWESRYEMVKKTLNKVCFKVETGLTDLHLRLREKPEGERTMSQCWWTRTTLSSIFEELVWCLLFLDELHNFKLVQNSWMPQDKLRFMMSLTLNSGQPEWEIVMLQCYNDTSKQPILYNSIDSSSMLHLFFKSNHNKNLLVTLYFKVQFLLTNH